MNINKHYDLIVIGAGSGGVRASRLAAQLGKKVALIECDKIGGTCVNRGCVPKKFMVYASEYAQVFEEARGFGWELNKSPVFVWQKFMQAKEKELERLGGIYQKNLEETSVNLYHAKASFLDKNTIKLSTGEIFSADKIVIATGAKPVYPHIFGVEHCISSDELLSLPQKPDSIIIYGGGYIAVEFANILHNLGVDTTLIYRGDMILRTFDNSLRQRLSNQMQERGIKIFYNSEIEEIFANKIKLRDGRHLEATQILMAIGRKPNIDSLDIAKSGVSIGTKGEILVDKYYQTSNENVYAIGDVKGGIQLAPVAIAEAICLIKNLYQDSKATIEAKYIATAVFSHPEIGTVGLTEDQAVEHYKNIDVFEVDFKPMRHAISGLKDRLYIKILVDKSSDLVVGLHILGCGASELIQVAAIALEASAKKSDFDKTMAVHPTASEELVLSYIPSYSYINGVASK